MNYHRSSLAATRLYPEEKALVESLAAYRGQTVSAMLQDLLRAEARSKGVDWPYRKIKFGRPKGTVTKD